MQSSQCFGTRFFILILKYRIKVNGAPGIPWASQVVLVIKNPPANAADVRNQVQSLGWEDPLEEEMAAHSGILAWRIRGQRSLVIYSPWGLKESATTKVT